MDKNFEQRSIESPSGASLNLYSLEALERPRGIVMILHGMAEHAARYQRFAVALSEAGFHVAAHDHRGHGATTAPDAPLGSFARRDGMEAVLADALHVNRHVRDTHPGLPVILFGHSMGGIIATNFLLRHSGTLDGAVLWNFNVDGGPLTALLALLLKAERMFKGSDVPSLIANRLTFEDWNRKFAPNRTDFDWLSRDVAEVDRYVADPLCGFPCSVGLWLDVLTMIRAASSDRALPAIRKDMPLHLLGGASDPSSLNGKAMERLATRLRKAGGSDVTFRLVLQTRHETLNEINRDEETAGIIEWLRARFQ